MVSVKMLLFCQNCNAHELPNNEMTDCNMAGTQKTSRKRKRKLCETRDFSVGTYRCMQLDTWDSPIQRRHVSVETGETERI